jgi:hypothetical protein
MVIFLYTNKTCEYQAISCIQSMEPHLTDDIKVVYFTIGFISSFESKNLIKVPIPERKYPTFHYYKAELSLDIMKMFPDEQNFIFTDTDILFSRRMDFHKLTHNHNYALGVFGPHDQPYIWTRNPDGSNFQVYDENLLMQYFNVKEKSVRYQWSCFYVFNRSCQEFFEEYTSMCKNEYLISRRNLYYPFHDETSFNVCIWKRGGKESLGFIFVNTHFPHTVRKVEESNIVDQRLGQNLDELGSDWEYIKDSSKVLLYHGIKDKPSIDETLSYLLSYANK